MRFLINLIKKIFLKFQLKFSKAVYNEKKYIIEQNKLFSELQLSREEGLKRLSAIKSIDKTLNTSMDSEHKVLLSSISLVNQSFKEILEIGTFDGKNALFLSKIFPDSKITTIDLDDEDDLFIKTYNRDKFEDRREFCIERDKILKSSKNIQFVKMNSLELYKFNQVFDLIWVDGAHGYPHVAIDIINSLRLLNDNGYLLCDDIWKSKPLIEDNIYQSIAGNETLKALQVAKLIKYKLIYKRIDKENNSNEKLRKFVAVAKKVSND